MSRAASRAAPVNRRRLRPMSMTTPGGGEHDSADVALDRCSHHGDVGVEFAFECLVEDRFEFGSDLRGSVDGAQVERSVEFGDGGSAAFV